MCCCWLGWWLPGRSRWTSYCVDEALWGPLCLRQKKVSWRRPAYSRPRSRSDTHPRHAKMHEWAQPDKSGKACMYTVLKISQAENGVCCLLVISCASKEHETLSFRIWTKKVNGPWTLLGSICCLWLPKESLWVLPSPWETLAPPPLFLPPLMSLLSQKSSFKLRTVLCSQLAVAPYLVACWWMLNNQLSGKNKPWLIAFAYLCGVNTPIIADFKLPTCYQWA